MNKPKTEDQNEQLETLGTHAAGATDLFETRTTTNEVSVDPPKHPGGAGSSGVY